MNKTIKHVEVGLKTLPARLQDNAVPAAFRKALGRASG